MVTATAIEQNAKFYITVNHGTRTAGILPDLAVIKALAVIRLRRPSGTEFTSRFSLTQVGAWAALSQTTSSADADKPARRV